MFHNLNLITKIHFVFIVFYTWNFYIKILDHPIYWFRNNLYQFSFPWFINLTYIFHTYYFSWKIRLVVLIIFDTFPKGKTLFQNATEHDKGMQDWTSIDHLKVIKYIYKTLEMKYNECLDEQCNFISYLTSIFRFYFGHNLFLSFFSLGRNIRHLHKLIFHISTFKK